MLEAISQILGLTLLAAMVAAIVGLVRGFRRKQWRLAWITGSIFGVIFVIAIIFIGATGQLDDLETETSATDTAISAQAALSVTAPPSVPQVSAPIPTPTSAPVSGLGISRDEVQRRFEQEFAGQGITFQATESTDGTPAVMGSVDSKRMGVILEGPEGELLQAYVLLNIGGASEEDVRMQFAAMNLLTDWVVPEWEGRREWILESSSFLGEFGVANFETTHDDKQIRFSYAPSTTQVLLTIELQQAATIEPTAIPVDGLGISRAEAQQPFENVGYSFEPTDPRIDNQPQTVAYGADGKVSIAMTGPDDDLVTAWVSGSIVDAVDELTIAMALLVQTVMPSDYDNVMDWLNDTLSGTSDNPDGYLGKEFKQTYGDKHVTLSTTSTSLTKRIFFKIDSSAIDLR